MQRKAESKAEAERRAGQREREGMFDTKFNFCPPIYEIFTVLLGKQDQLLADRCA